MPTENEQALNGLDHIEWLFRKGEDGFINAEAKLYYNIFITDLFRSLRDDAQKLLEDKPSG